MTSSPSSTSIPRTPAAFRPSAHLFLGEPDDHAELGRDHDLAPAIGAPGGHDLVRVLEADRLDPPARGWEKASSLGLLHLALLGREQDVAPAAKSRTGTPGRDQLASPSDSRFTMALPFA